MYRITRISSAPASTLRVQVAQPDGTDAGLAAGGTYAFEPDGPDTPIDDRAVTVSEAIARAIMSDPGHAAHFRCDPPLPAPPAEAVEAPTVLDATPTPLEPVAPPPAPARRR